MRAAPGRIPKTLPDTGNAVRMIQREVLDRPDTRLTDLSIGQLILDLNDGTPAYLTGSNVWLRSVFGGVPGCPEICRRASDCLCSRLDYDVVFSSDAATERFLTGTLWILNRRIPEGHAPFVRDTNSFDNGRIRHPNGEAIIDAWSLDPGESIGELLMGYPEAYQRSALHVSQHITAGSLFRIVRADFDVSRIGRASRHSRYPGRD